MDFTIAICTWNRAALLKRTLESLAALHLPPHASWEILVVNNRCTDETDEVIASFTDRLPIRRLFEDRPGQSAARNLALAEFHGEKLIFTDDDVVVDGDWITALLEAFSKYAADVVFGRSHPLWLSAQPTWFGSQFAGQFALLDYGPTPLVVTDTEHQFFGVNVAFTRAAALALGRYREDVGIVGKGGGGGDDTDMFERCRAERMRIVYEPRAIIAHMIPPDRTTKRRQRELAWRGGRANYRLTAAKFSGPKWFGVQRFMYRIGLEDAAALVLNAVRGNRSEAFYREIRLIRLVALIREGVRDNMRGRNTTSHP